jgi:hypothetical protein
VLRDPFKVIERPAAIGRVVTATITLVCVLIVYDGWAKLRVVDVVLIILGPIIAIFISHVFSTTLVLQVELGRRPTRSEWFANARFESRFLLLAVPPLTLLLLLDLAAVSIQDSVRAVIWMEALSLAFWTGLAAWLVGMRGRPLVLAVLAGLVVTCVVIVLQVALQPGRALQGGTAAEPPGAIDLVTHCKEPPFGVGGVFVPLSRSVESVTRTISSNPYPRTVPVGGNLIRFTEHRDPGGVSFHGGPIAPSLPVQLVFFGEVGGRAPTDPLTARLWNRK